MTGQILTVIFCAAAFTLLYLGGEVLKFGVFLKAVDDILHYVSMRAKAWRYLVHGADMITAEYKKAAGKAFEVPGPDHNHVFVSSDQHLSEVRKANRNELSLFGATKQMFQPAYTMLGHNWLDERGAEGIGYVRAVGTLFPRQLLNIMPDMQRIIQSSFEEYAAPHMLSSGDLRLQVYEMHKKMLCKLNGFCFFGDELADNDIFMTKIFQYNELVITAAEILRVLPEPVKRFVGPYVGKHTSVQNVVFDMINDVVARRMEEKELSATGQIHSSPRNDMIQWIIDTAPPELGWGARRVTYEIIAIWFGSVHALSASVTHVLFDLCVHPDYVEPLREEIESPAFYEFMQTTKGLPLLDSFIKESSRLNPIEAMSGRRQALKDFAFSDGTQVKKGDWTCVPAKAILSDDTFFPEASRFEGFRFAPRDKIPGYKQTIMQPEGPSRFADISAHYHAWGIGGIVCPGRFYASVATKLVLAYFLQNFNCSLVGPHKKHSSSWRSYVLPKENVLIEFSRRG